MSDYWGLYPLLHGKDKVVSFYGAGGKTSLINSLAEENLSRGKKLIITTTTKIWPPEKYSLVIASSLKEALNVLPQKLREGKAAVLGRCILSSGKVEGVPASWIDKLAETNLADSILVEGDGAAAKPAKGFAPHEPVIPASTTALLPILGLDAWGKPINEYYFHRHQILCQKLGWEEGEQFSLHHLAALINYMVEMGRQLSPDGLIVPCLNKADLLQDTRVLCRNLPPKIKKSPLLLLTTTRRKPLVQVVYCRAESDERSNLMPLMSIVVLAAGLSRRMGSPKLLLNLAGKKVLSYGLEAALASDADEVLVVIPPDSNELKLLVKSYFLNPIINDNYQKGQSFSLKAGLQCISPLAQGALFLLGDQPLIKSSEINKMISSYKSNFNLINYPLYRGKRGNPALFDRRLFPKLLELKGDEGGRSLIERIGFSIPVEVDSCGVVKDLDTPDDFLRLQKSIVVVSQDQESP